MSPVKPLPQPAQIYLVGGAVRDQLLGLPVKDRDWVVVGATAQMMVDAGYRPVGSDFPVFIDPTTQEEFALARTERKQGVGYKGFLFHATPDVSLEEDLKRRDLSINAIAQDASGALIDPYQGQQDLNARVLRHVSPAFAEDPLRVLRVARFAARFAPLGFTVAPETLTLMRELSQSGELAELTAERVWLETERALATQTPTRFFEVLSKCDALVLLFPEFDGIELHRLAKLDDERLHTSDERFAALIWLIAESRSIDQSTALKLFEGLVKRLRIPNRFRDKAQKLVQHGPVLAAYSERPAEQRLAAIKTLKLIDQPETLEQLIPLVETVSERALDSARIHRDLSSLRMIKPASLIAEGFNGAALGAELSRRQIASLEAVQSD